MLIRNATVQDAMDISEVHVRSWQAAYRGIVPQDHLDALDPVARSRWVQDFLTDPGATVCTLVAVREERLVGFITFGGYRLDRQRPDSELDPTMGEIHAIYVWPEDWRIGAGHALMEAALRELAAQGRHEVRLWVLRANESARRFYVRNGFVADGHTGVFRLERGADPAVEFDEVRYVLGGGTG